MAGIMEHMGALLALTNPSVNSFRRMQPGCVGIDDQRACLCCFLGDESGVSALGAQLPFTCTQTSYKSCAHICRLGSDII